MSRQTIGENPLDALLMSPEEVKEKPKKKQNLSDNGPQKPTNGNKQRLTVQISEDITERAKNAVYWTRGLTLAKLTEEALEKAIKALEKNSVIFDDETGKPLKNKGEPFLNRKEELKRGRPIK
jgi:hypothetical protein